MRQKDITSMRSIIEWLIDRDEIMTVKGEVDPIYEISAIVKSFDGGPALLFDNIKGYPGVRHSANVFSKMERIYKMFDSIDAKVMKLKGIKAVRKSIPPRVITEAPCQEVIVKKNIDLMATFPVLKHTEQDGGRFFGGGVALISGGYFGEGNHVAFHRMNFRGKDWSTIFFTLGGHAEWAVFQHKEEKTIPLTINISPPPAVALMAAAGSNHTIIPNGSDELGIAGALQGSPIDIVKAKTTDAYSIANSEWIIEGNIDTSHRIWETEEAEKIGKIHVAPFFPEYYGYMGGALKAYRFQATAITHRKNKPIFSSPLADSYECCNMAKPINEACLWEIGERMNSGFVLDVNIPDCQRGYNGVVFQVKKRAIRDEGYQKNLIQAVFGACPSIAMVVVVDEDVNIYSAEDVLWAMTHRVDPYADVVRGIAQRGAGYLPLEFTTANVSAGAESRGLGIGIDATRPFGQESAFQRARFPVDKIDLRKWFSEEQIAAGRALQCEYARYIAEKGL